MSIDFAAVVDALPGLVCITRSDGQSDFVNHGWSAYTGLNLDLSLGRGWQAAIHPDDLTTLQASWNSIERSGESNEIDLRLRRADGEYRWFAFRRSILPQDAGIPQRWCWLGLHADETTTTDGRQRRLWDMVPIRLGFISLAGVLEFSNLQARQRDFDTTIDEMRSWRNSGIIHADDVERNEGHVKALLTTGRMYDHEIRMRHKGGVYRWTHARAVPIRDAQGNIVRFLGCQIDIDDLKRAEALLAAEVRLLEMVARGETLAQVLDALSHGIEELCDGCFCSVLLVIQGRKGFQLGSAPSLPSAYTDLIDSILVDSGDSPHSLAVIERAAVCSVNLINDRRWEGSSWLLPVKNLGVSTCCATPIKSASGIIRGVVGIYRTAATAPTAEQQDLIDRLAKIAGIAIDRAHADTALRTSERELREALVQLTDGQRLSKTGSFTSDIQQDEHRWSEELYRILEIDANTPARLDAVRERVHPDDVQLFDTQMQRRFEGSGADFNFRIVTPKGGLKYLRGVSQIINHLGERPIFMGAVQDVTDSKTAEDALNRARSELAHVARVTTLNAMTASITHEVSQPLSGIMTNADTCARMLAANPPNLVGAAETIRRTIRDANRASDVIKRLRAMFSNKASTTEMVDINDATNEVIVLSSGELRRKRAALQTDFTDNLPRVSADRVQLQQVILNLLLNAADAMAEIEDRPRSILVKTMLYDDGSVHLAVRDAGAGVEPQTVERLFEPFYTTKAQGMGIGLSICRSIIQNHNGRLWAMANDDGPGATFMFCIPVGVAQ